MRKELPGVIGFAIAALIVSWLPYQHFSASRQPVKGALYLSPDDPNGANVYDFYRLRNPFTGELPLNMHQNELAFAQHLPKYDDVTRSAGSWQNRGPYNLGGRTRAIALDVTNENTILAGQVTGGVWRSDNGGASFTQTLQPEQLHSTTCIVQDTRPGHTSTWYHGTGEEYAIVNAAGFSSQFAGDGIFKSTDGAHTWSQLTSTLDTLYPSPFYGQRNFDFVWQMVINPADTVNDEVYAATVNGIWRSPDGGNTWAPVLGLDTGAALEVSLYSDIAVTPGGVFYATISSETPSGGIYRSTNGINWVNITPAGLPTSFERIEMGIAPSDPNQVYFIAQTPQSGVSGHNLWHYHYLSGDGTGSGGTWTNLTANIPHDHCELYFGIDFKAYNSQDSYDMFISVHPTDTAIVFLGGTDLYRSTDGFTTYDYNWIGGYKCDTADLANYVYPGHHPDQHRLIFLPSNNQVAFSATDGGLMKSDDILADTVVWQLMNNGYNTGQFYTCTVEPGNTNSQMIIGGLQDNGTYFTNTNNFTQSWPKVFYGDGGYCAITHGRTNYYMSIEEGKTYKLAVTDSGVVTGLTRIDPTGGAAYLFIAPFMLDPTNDSIMYLAAGSLIWRNDSLPAIPITGNQYNPISQGWTKLTGSLTGGGVAAPSISCLSISEANPNVLYYGTSDGQVYKLDSCRTFSTTQKINITGSNFPSGAYVSSIQADRLNPNLLLITFSNYGVISVFYSVDGGQTWTDVAGNLEENPDGSGNGPSVDWAHMYNNGTSTTYYAGTDVGLFSTRSLNGLNTVWTQEGANTIGNVVIDMVISRAYDSLVVVATHGNGIYTNKIFTPTAIKVIQPSVLDFTCYPNPSSNSVTFSAGSSAPGLMEADIYDISGKLVKKLVQANTNTLIWNGNSESGSPRAAGTYLVRLSLNGTSSFKKIVKL